MSDKQLYVLAGYDNGTEEHLAGIQQKLYDAGFVGVHTKNLPQHITLGSFPTEMEAELCGLLEKASSEADSFDVTFNHIGIFGGREGVRTRVLFISPDTSHALLDLKERFGSADNWTPHTTMLIDEEDAVCDALKIVMKEFSAFRGRVTALHLYEFFPTRYIMSVNLK